MFTPIEAIYGVCYLIALIILIFSRSRSADDAFVGFFVITTLGIIVSIVIKATLYFSGFYNAVG